MKRLSFVFFLLVMVLWPLTPRLARAVEGNQPAPDFRLTDSLGQPHSLVDFKGKYVVLEWTNYECPFVRKHYDSGNMQRLQQEFTAEGVVWLTINSSAEGKQGYFAPEQINELINEQDAAPTAYLLDTAGEVGQLYSAQTTPHVYLINPAGQLIYQGAIDSIPSFDQEDILKASNYLRLAYQESLRGEQIGIPETKAYGCSVKY